jgi:hypothetical protein
MHSFVTNLAYYSSRYGYDYSTTRHVNEAVWVGIGIALVMGLLLVALAAYIFLGYSLMRIFRKAGYKNVWAGFVPIYGSYVLYEIAGRPGWWVLLGFIPVFGGIILFALSVVVMVDLAKSFGKDPAYAILLVLLPFIGLPILAFDRSSYLGSSVPKSQIKKTDRPVKKSKPTTKKK